jgi:hypothetical protein
MAIKKFLTDIDFNQNQSISRVIENRATVPSSPIKGQEYFDTTTNKAYFYNGTTWIEYGGSGGGGGTVTSVGLSMPSAFAVTNSPITGSGTINVTGNGVASQYVRGDGVLAPFPTTTGGGSSVTYYLNGSVNQGTFGGNTYYEINRTPIIGAGTDFTTNVDGFIARFITDVGDPNLINIPIGAWNCGFFFSASSGGGTPNFYVNIYKTDGVTFTLLGSNSAFPEQITGGTSIDQYFFSVAITTSSLLATDRIAIEIYVVTDGRTITLHTEDSHLGEIITTFSSGLTALNGLTAQVQDFQTGTSGTDFGISSSGSIHTFNLPIASATVTGKLSSTDWTAFNNKADNNIYTADGTISGTRTVTFDNSQVIFSGVNGITTIKLDLKATAGSGNRYAKLSAQAGSNTNSVDVSGGSVGLSSVDTGITNTINVNTTLISANYTDGLFAHIFTIDQTSLYMEYNNSINVHKLAIDDNGVKIDNQYYLPTTDGSAGQVVTTNGGGVLTFQDVTSIPSFIPFIQQSEIRRGTIGLNNSVTFGTYGDYTPTPTGTVQALNMATGTVTKLPKCRIYSTTSTTNSVVGQRYGAQSLIQTLEFGFRFVGSYVFSDVNNVGVQQFAPNARQFCGLTDSSAILGINNTVTVQSLLNIIGIGSDVGDTNLQIFHNDGSGTATKINLGSDFPANKTGAVANGIGYMLELYATPSATSVNYRVTRLTDFVQTQGTISTNLPALTTLLCPQIVRTSGSSASLVSIDFIQLNAYTLD